MSKVQVTLTFDSLEDAVEFLSPVPQVEFKIGSASGANADAVVGASVHPEPDVQPVKARKPRSDAGRPRGSYKTTEESAATQEAKVKDATSTEASVGAAPLGASPPAVVADLTISDVRAAMEVLSKKKNIDANMKLLAVFGVEKASALPKEKYAEFIAAARKAAA